MKRAFEMEKLQRDALKQKLEQERKKAEEFEKYARSIDDHEKLLQNTHSEESEHQKGELTKCRQNLVELEGVRNALETTLQDTKSALNHETQMHNDLKVEVEKYKGTIAEQAVALQHMKELQEQLAQEKSEKCELDNTLRTAQSTIADIKEDVKSLQHQVETLSENVHALEANVREKESQIQHLQTELTTSQNTAAKLQHDIETLTENTTHHLKREAAFKDEISELTEQLYAQKTVHEELKDSHRLTQKEVEHLKVTHDHLEDSIQQIILYWEHRCDVAVDISGDMYTFFRETLTDMEVILQNKDAEVSNMKMLVTEAEESSMQAKMREVELTEQLEVLMSSKSKEKQDATEKYAKALRDVELKVREVEQLQAHLQATTESLHVMKKQRDDFEDQLFEREDSKAKARKQVEVLEIEVKQVRQSLAKAESEIQDRAKDIERLEQHLAKEKHQVSVQQEEYMRLVELNAKEAEKNKAQEQELNHTVNMLRKDVINLKSSKQQLEDILNGQTDKKKGEEQMLKIVELEAKLLENEAQVLEFKRLRNIERVDKSVQVVHRMRDEETQQNSDAAQPSVDEEESGNPEVPSAKQDKSKKLKTVQPTPIIYDDVTEIVSCEPTQHRDICTSPMAPPISSPSVDPPPLPIVVIKKGEMKHQETQTIQQDRPKSNGGGDEQPSLGFQHQQNNTHRLSNALIRPVEELTLTVEDQVELRQVNNLAPSEDNEAALNTLPNDIKELKKRILQMQHFQTEAHVKHTQLQRKHEKREEELLVEVDRQIYQREQADKALIAQKTEHEEKIKGVEIQHMLQARVAIERAQLRVTELTNEIEEKNMIINDLHKTNKESAAEAKSELQRIHLVLEALEQENEKLSGALASAISNPSSGNTKSIVQEQIAMIQSQHSHSLANAKRETTQLSESLQKAQLEIQFLRKLAESRADIHAIDAWKNKCDELSALVKKYETELEKTKSDLRMMRQKESMANMCEWEDVGVQVNILGANTSHASEDDQILKLRVEIDLLKKELMGKSRKVITAKVKGPSDGEEQVVGVYHMFHREADVDEQFKSLLKHLNCEDKYIIPPILLKQMSSADFDVLEASSGCDDIPSLCTALSLRIILSFKAISEVRIEIPLLAAFLLRVFTAYTQGGTVYSIAQRGVDALQCLFVLLQHKQTLRGLEVSSIPSLDLVALLLSTVCCGLGNLDCLPEVLDDIKHPVGLLYSGSGNTYRFMRYAMCVGFIAQSGFLGLSDDRKSALVEKIQSLLMLSQGTETVAESGSGDVTSQGVTMSLWEQLFLISTVAPHTLRPLVVSQAWSFRKAAAIVKSHMCCPGEFTTSNAVAINTIESICIQQGVQPLSRSLKDFVPPAIALEIESTLLHWYSLGSGDYSDVIQSMAQSTPWGPRFFDFQKVLCGALGLPTTNSVAMVHIFMPPSKAFEGPHTPPAPTAVVLSPVPNLLPPINRVPILDHMKKVNMETTSPLPLAAIPCTVFNPLQTFDKMTGGLDTDSKVGMDQNTAIATLFARPAKVRKSSPTRRLTPRAARQSAAGAISLRTLIQPLHSRAGGVSDGAIFRSRSTTHMGETHIPLSPEEWASLDSFSALQSLKENKKKREERQQEKVATEKN